MSRAFFDSSVLVYAVVKDDPRWVRADQLLGRGGVIGVQSLNELANVLRRKFGFDLGTYSRVRTELLEVCEPPVPLTLDLHEGGVRLALRYGFKLYDSMIVAAALTAGCDVLYSEDLHDGLVIDGRLTVRNPFVQAAG